MRPPRPGLPHANTALAQFLQQRIDELRGVRTQREIAHEAGFERSNILSMFKRGETRVPLDRVPSLARALQADPAHVLRLGLRDTWPELAAVIHEVFGRQMASVNEADIFLKKWRAATNDRDPGPNAQINAAVDRAITEMFKAP